MKVLPEERLFQISLIILASLSQNLTNFMQTGASFISLYPPCKAFFLLRLHYTVCLQKNKGGNGKQTTKAKFPMRD